MEKLYKNWPEICKAWKLDPLFAFWISGLDISEFEKVTINNVEYYGEIERRNKRREFSHKIVEALPMFFSEELLNGPIPLSMIKHETKKRREEEAGRTIGRSHITVENAYESRCPQSFGALDFFDLPYLTVCWDADEVREEEGELFIPKELEQQYSDTTKQWDIFDFNGKKIVLAEYRSGVSDLCHCAIDYFVPLECIALQL